MAVEYEVIQMSMQLLYTSTASTMKYSTAHYNTVQYIYCEERYIPVQPSPVGSRCVSTFDEHIAAAVLRTPQDRAGPLLLGSLPGGHLGEEVVDELVVDFSTGHPHPNHTTRHVNVNDTSLRDCGAGWRDQG